LPDHAPAITSGAAIKAANVNSIPNTFHFITFLPSVVESGVVLRRALQKFERGDLDGLATSPEAP
jgi:hypothetical protein